MLIKTIEAHWRIRSAVWAVAYFWRPQATTGFGATFQTRSITIQLICKTANRHRWHVKVSLSPHGYDLNINADKWRCFFSYVLFLTHSQKSIKGISLSRATNYSPAKWKEEKKGGISIKLAIWIRNLFAFCIGNAFQIIMIITGLVCEKNQYINQILLIRPVRPYAASHFYTILFAEE